MLKRSLAVLFVLALAVAACSDDSKPEEPPPPQEKPAAERIVGRWVQGRQHMAFRGDGSFTWHQERPCGAPPCPVVIRAGTYALTGNTLTMTLTSGQTIEAQFKFVDPGRKLWVSVPAYNTEMTLEYTNP